VVPRDTRPEPATLVVSALSDPIQVVFNHADHTRWKMSGLLNGVRSKHRQQRYSFRSAVTQFVAVRHTKFGEQAFSQTRPAAWNSRLVEIRFQE
jgi:hypothetical protein